MTVSGKWKAESVFAAGDVPNGRGPCVASKSAKSRADLGLRENRYMCIYGWVPLLFTWNYHNIANRLHSKKSRSTFQTVYSALAGSKRAVLMRPRPLCLLHTTRWGGRRGGSCIILSVIIYHLVEDCVFLSFVCFNVNAASIYTTPLIIDKAHFQAREETTLESLRRWQRRVNRMLN